MDRRGRILVVEDEPSQVEILSYNLDKAGFVPLIARNGSEGLEMAREEVPDLVILDWMLPGLSGVEICRQLRASKATSEIPIIMLSARSEEDDRVRGIETGADDYLTKPYSIAELIARIKGLLRRVRPSLAGQLIAFDDLAYNPATQVVSRGGRALRLGPTELRLLTVLIEKPGRVFTRDQLLDLVWGRDAAYDSRTVDVHVGRLRKSLCPQGENDPIRTVRGTGYSLG